MSRAKAALVRVVEWHSKSREYPDLVWMKVKKKVCHVAKWKVYGTKDRNGKRR